MSSSNTSASESQLDAALGAIPAEFRKRIIAPYLELKHRQAKAQYDASYDAAGLSAGKFCEAVLRWLQKDLTGTATKFGTHITNFPDECRKIIILPKEAGVESLRIIVPRSLVFLYTLRGKRGIGHVGGDVEANEIDLATITRVADWIVCELIRVYHKLSLEQAQAIVDAIAIRKLPDVWEVAGRKRVLRAGLSYKDKALLLLYGEPEGNVLVEDLFTWVEHSKKSSFKRDVLNPLHNARLIEYDREAEIVYLSPTGIQHVEDNVLTG